VEETDFKSAIFAHFRPWWPWPRFGSYGILSCVTRHPLPTYQISFKSPTIFWRRMGVRIRMYGRWNPL